MVTLGLDLFGKRLPCGRIHGKAGLPLTSVEVLHAQRVRPRDALASGGLTVSVTCILWAADLSGPAVPLWAGRARREWLVPSTGGQGVMQGTCAAAGECEGAAALSPAPFGGR